MDQGRNQEINEYIAGTKWKWKHNTTKSLGHIKSSFIREAYSLFAYIKKIRKSRNKWFNYTAENFGKTRTIQTPKHHMARNNKIQNWN